VPLGQLNRRREELPVKIGIIPESFVERLALALGLVPAPAFEARFSVMLAWATKAGTKVGTFALAAGPLSGPKWPIGVGRIAGRRVSFSTPWSVPVA
jgi:hypothetical protein